MVREPRKIRLRVIEATLRGRFVSRRSGRVKKRALGGDGGMARGDHRFSTGVRRQKGRQRERERERKEDTERKREREGERD